MTNDLIFSCVECITFYYLLSLVCLFTFFPEGKGRGRISLGLSLSLCLEGPKVGLVWVSVCMNVYFLCNSCYIYVVYLLSWKKILNKQKHCCKEQTYFFSSKKCGECSCETCTSLRLPTNILQQISHLPDPVPEDDATINIYGSTTTEQFAIVEND